MGTHGMHDVTEGGILGAIWEMCRIAGVGAEIHETAVAVKDVTRKSCAHYGIDYMRLISSGSMIIMAGQEKKNEIIKKLAEAIEDLIYKKGLLKGELSQFYTLLELATTYEQKVAEQKGLEVELVKTKNLIQAKMASQDQRRSKVLERMQEHGVYFLHHDQECQRAFSEASPSEFQVDFSNNIVYLQDRFAKYSASSTFFLKLVARFSLFFASLDIDWMRYPRFIFADNMEDKGIEKERAQKFQYTLIDKLKEYPADSYQLIYTTSYITDELDHSEYVVGDHYDINNKSLRNVRND